MKRFAILFMCLFLSAGACLAEDTVVSDPALLFQYYRFNTMHFSGKLPIENVIVKWDETISKLQVAGTRITHYEGEPEKVSMGISLYAKDCETCVSMAILHEMVHIKLRDRNWTAKDLHGDEFQKEMLELAKQGAFNQYW